MDCCKDGVAWLKACLVICILMAVSLSRYCVDDYRFMVGAVTTDRSRYAGLSLIVFVTPVSRDVPDVIFPPDLDSLAQHPTDPDL